MNKSELVASVAEKSGLTKKDAEKAVNAVFDSITATLVSGEKVQLMSDARISVTKQLLEYLDENGWNYRVEGRENPDKKEIETDAEIEEVDTFSLVNDD